MKNPAQHRVVSGSNAAFLFAPLEKHDRSCPQKSYADSFAIVKQAFASSPQQGEFYVVIL